MKVQFMPGVAAISGSTKSSKTGVRVVFKNLKSDKPGHGHAYFVPAGGYDRKTPLSEAELAAQSLFKKRAALVKKLMLEQHLTKAEAWKVAKQQIRKENV